MTSSRSLLLPMLAALLLLPLIVHADDDDAAPATASSSALPSLSSAQQQAAGVVVAHPVKARPSARTEAYAQVLDPSVLVADRGRLQSTRAAEHVASTELSRLQKLYRGSGASLKAVETAQAAQIEARARARSARADFALHWGPLARLSDAAQQKLIDALLAGSTLLLRADLPGRHSLGRVPHTAVLDVDGVRTTAQVLGTLPQTATNLQSVGLLLRMDHPPTGLGVGARLSATLEGTPRSGVVVPDGALLYGDQSAYVYRRLTAKAGNGDAQFAPVPVTLLQRLGDGWLVGGIDDDDSVVIHGAGVLWSLQGLGNVSDDDD